MNEPTLEEVLAATLAKKITAEYEQRRHELQKAIDELPVEK